MHRMSKAARFIDCAFLRMLREESGRVHIGRAILFAVMGLGLLLEILVRTPPEILFNGISKAVWSLPTFRKARADVAEIERAAEEAADEQAERGTREWYEIYEQELRERVKESDMYENWIERIRSKADEYDYDEVSDTYDEGSSTQDDGYDYED